MQNRRRTKEPFMVPFVIRRFYLAKPNSEKAIAFELGHGSQVQAYITDTRLSNMPDDSANAEQRESASFRADGTAKSIGVQRGHLWSLLSFVDFIRRMPNSEKALAFSLSPAPVLCCIYVQFKV